MTLTLVPLPIGRVAMPQLLRLDDKPRAITVQRWIDVSAFASEVPGDQIMSLAVTVQPAVIGGITVSAPKISGGQVSASFAGGVEGQDYAVVFTGATRQGRQFQRVARLYVPPVIP